MATEHVFALEQVGGGVRTPFGLWGGSQACFGPARSLVVTYHGFTKISGLTLGFTVGPYCEYQGGNFL